MSDLYRLIWCALIGLFRPRAALEAEILVLRHQLNVLRRKSPKRLAFGNCPSRKSFPRVAMMQSGQDWCDDDDPRSLDGSSLRRILRQSEVCACLIVIERIQSQNSPQMPFVEDQDMVQAVAPECPRSGAQHRGLTCARTETTGANTG